MKVFGIAGYSGSGKTTLLEKLIPQLTARGLKVSVIKHAHHGFDIDKPGKDSYRHREAGATEVLLSCGDRWALMHERRDEVEPSLNELIGHLSPCDLVLIEGFKQEPVPKLEVYRPENGKPPLFPERADIRDHQVCLVDENNTIRTDLDNKAADESWPQLSNFFYTDLRQFGFLPLAVSDGPTHDNHTAIGYQTYGGEVDQWGGSWTPQQINEFYFGIAVRATNRSSLGYRGDAFIDHAKLTVYTRPRFDRTVNMRVEVAVSNHFYLEREVFGGIMNLIELGEKLAVEED